MLWFIHHIQLAIDIQRTFYPRFLLDITELFYASTYTESYCLCIHLFTINLETFNSYVKALTSNTNPWASNILPGIFNLPHLTISSQVLFFFEFSIMAFVNDFLIQNISSYSWNGPKLYSLINMRQLQFYSIKPKLGMGLFVDLAEFTCFYQFLHVVILKLFCFDLKNNFRITSCKNW